MLLWCIKCPRAVFFSSVVVNCLISAVHCGWRCYRWERCAAESGCCETKKSLLYYRSPGDSCIVSTNSLSCGKAARFSGFLQVREMGCWVWLMTWAPGNQVTRLWLPAVITTWITPKYLRSFTVARVPPTRSNLTVCTHWQLLTSTFSLPIFKQK